MSKGYLANVGLWMMERGITYDPKYVHFSFFSLFYFRSLFIITISQVRWVI